MRPKSLAKILKKSLTWRSRRIFTSSLRLNLLASQFSIRFIERNGAFDVAA